MQPEQKQHRRYSRHITRGPRWKALRMQALERDGWACVDCGRHTRLECDHIKPVRTHPELAYVLSNLAIRCGPCHSHKTRIEMGLAPLNPKRHEWREFLRNEANHRTKGEHKC